MSFSEIDVSRRTRKGNFLNQIDYLIDWVPIEKAIVEHYAPTLAMSQLVIESVLFFQETQGNKDLV